MRLAAAVLMAVWLVMPSVVSATEKVAEKVADAPAEPANEWHGTVGCAKCDFADSSGAEECLPSVKTANGIYLLKAGAGAPPAVKEFLARIQEKEMIGDYLIKGELTELDGKKWVAVSSMVAKPLPKTTATLSLNRKKNSSGAGGAAADQGGGGGADEGGGGRRGRGRRHRPDGGGDAGGGGGGEEGQ